MKLKKGFIYVLVANIINLMISLITGFVLPKILSIETYASIKLFQLYITYIGVVSLGFGDGMYLRLGGKEIENIDKKEVLEELKTFDKVWIPSSMDQLPAVAQLKQHTNVGVSTEDTLSVTSILKEVK